MALQIILCLDAAHESRALSNEEGDIRARLKRRVIGLALEELGRCNPHESLIQMKVMQTLSTSTFASMLGALKSHTPPQAQ
jgi:hypothetical protein